MHGSYSGSYGGSCCVLTEGMETLDARQTGARMQDMDIMDLHPSLTPEVEDFLPELDLDGFLEHEDFPFDFNDALFDLDFTVDIQTGEVAMPTAVAEPGDQKQNCETQRELGDGQRKRETELGDGQRKRGSTEAGDGQRKRRSTEPGDRQRKRAKRRAAEAGDGQRKRRATEPGDGQRKRETQTDSPIRGCAGSPPLSAVTLSPPPPRFVQIAPSLLYIPGFGTATFVSSCSNGSELQLVQAPVFGFSRPPTYILMSSPSLSPRTLDVLPLSPVDGEVAPDSMCSYPPGSLSDCASQALSPPSASPLSPRTEEYIHQAKAHLRGMCQEMEAGLSLASHYVDVRLVQRQILIGSGKNTSKCLEKDLVVIGDAERRRGSLARSQVFESSLGAKPKRSIVLLGNAGMGKSTLIKKLCVDWSDGLLPQFDFVFLLDGKALTLPPEPTYSLRSLLLHLSCPHPRDVFNQVLSVPERVLVIFDGFEVVRDLEGLLQFPADDSKGENYSVRQLFSGLLQRKLLPGCSLLLSARPRGTVSGLLKRADSLLELSGFSPPDIERYLGQYFSGQSLEAPALTRLHSQPYLLSMCWNPALCHMVCLLLEHWDVSDPLPSTLTGLCYSVLLLKMRRHTRKHTHCQTLPQTQTQAHTHTLKHSQKHTLKHTRNWTRTHIRTRSHTQSQREEGEKEREEKREEEREREEGEKERQMKREEGEKERQEKREEEVREREEEEEEREEKREEEERERVEGEEEKEKEREEENRCVLSELSGLAWQGVKGHSSLLTLTLDNTVCVKLRLFGLRTGLVHSHWLRGEQGRDGDGGGVSSDNILSWAHPFLQSFLGGAHLSVSSCVSDRALLAQILPQPRGRRRPQGECLDLAQRFAVGLLFRNNAELRDLATLDTGAMKVVAAKRAAVISHLENLHHGDLSPARLLEACHCVYETGDIRLVRHLVRNLPEVLSFQGVPLCPADAFVVWNLLDQCRTLRRRFCLGLEDTGLRMTGLKLLTGLNNIHSYRACIADTITLWEELEQSGEEELLKAVVSKLTLNPFRATQVSHVQHLSTLVNIHTSRRLSESQSDGVLGEGLPAVRDLHKLEFELGPVNGPLALPKLLELLPALHSLHHLDLENSKLGDSGAEGLAGAVLSLSSLQIINLSQNCIVDQGIESLAPALSTLPSLHCLSLYSNVISDGGAESLAAVLPQMTSLSDLDVKYNSFTALGAQSLASSLRDCPWIKSLGMWNVCIPYGVLERLQQQDPRIQLL
ncbi:MHC class II transactivator-like [Oncorhynchus clarkii lewisi]|uniref:MHC class II transactivator-like n=1 Tax=Oncorhynchus clarkii lewisi TaxID=490388 RepID=UPI0039B9BC5B